jgi:hypothetical protein
MAASAGVFALLAVAPPAFSQPSIATPPQVRFEQGLQLFLDEDYFAAAQLFEQLYAETGSERVRLEWARAAYLARDYDKAKALFKDVLAAAPPLPVREKIKVFLEDISLAQGRLDYSLSLVRDSNPRSIPGVRTFNLFGLPFEYKPQFDTSPKWGMNYRLLASKGLDPSRRWIASAGVLGTHYADPAMNKTGYEAHVAYRLAFEPRIELKVSQENMDTAGKPLYRYVWLTGLYVLENQAGWRLSNELRHGTIEYPLYDYQNSTLSNYRLVAEKALTAFFIAGVDLGWDIGRAKEGPYSYSGSSIGLAGTYYASSLDAKFQVKWSASRRQHAAPDPLFEIRRQDRRRNLTLNIEPSNFKIAGLIPAVELGYEKNDSTLPLSNYNRVIASMSFKRSY